jgi:potassium efflux system protein
LLGLVLFALLWHRRAALRKSLKRCGRNVGQLRHDRFYYSIKALMLTLILALPLPLFFAALGLHLQSEISFEGIDISPNIYDIADWSGQIVPAVGAAFYGIAFVAFNFIAFRLFCVRRGLASAHFHWRRTSTELLRRETLRLMMVFLPVVFLLTAIVTYNPAALAGGFSRIMIGVVCVALVVFFARVLSPNRGAMRDFYRENPRNLLSWLRYLWFVLGFVLPLLLAGLATTGFVYTSTQLGARLTDTLWLIVAIVLIHQLVVRWVILLERQLQFKDTLERHRAQRAAREAQDGEPGSIEPVEEPEIDFSALSDNTQKLINTAVIVVAAFGMWAIWSAVLPAFRFLDDVSLWSYSSTVEGASKMVPVTLGNLVSGLMIIFFGTITAMRLPALMEILLFARFNVTAGSRYAISKLTQYSIIAIGIVWAASVLGGSWGEIQWLIAALGVGIGFGLQEIIANFICGLILLFERPIRLGDIVTVGETSGIVTRIQIRSTTIRNWDQQELLVPNKEFITGRLLNWTLSDPLARIVISVGIAYGSDIEKALKILLTCAEQHERVIEEPAPLVTFESFGDNALDLKLRCYIGSMDYRLLTLSEINLAINRKMEAAGIVIAFPQRDVHLDTSQPLELRIHRQPEEIPQT